jgi:hypothetical protein
MAEMQAQCTENEPHNAQEEDAMKEDGPMGPDSIEVLQVSQHRKQVTTDIFS